MLPLNKVELTAYRYSGLVGSSFTLFQSVVWLMMSLAGAFCKYSKCGADSPKTSFAHCFYLTYYYEPENFTNFLPGNLNRVNSVSPESFHGIMWFSAVLSVANIVASAFTIKEFVSWTNARNIKILAKVWPIWIICLSCIELILCVVFIYDIMSIHRKEGQIKCFKKANTEILRSAYTNERNPAPYLLHLKSNLQTMKKKVKRMKKKLQFLNTIVDIKNPDHLKNPFISQKLATDYVEKIWKDMFNNSIREMDSRKTKITPNDELLKNFIIRENINLDELDEDLLKNFDGLTNIKYVKPIKSSNMVFGKQFDLSPSITFETPSVTDDAANLMLEYFKQSDEKSTNYAKFDEKIADFFAGLAEKRKHGNTLNKSDNKINGTDKSFSEKLENTTKLDQNYGGILIEKLNGTDKIQASASHVTKRDEKIDDLLIQAENYTKFDRKFDDFFQNLFENLKDGETLKFHNETDAIIESSGFPEKLENYTKFDRKSDEFSYDVKLPNYTNEIEPSIFPEKSENYTKYDQKLDAFFGNLFEKYRDEGEPRKSYNKINVTDKNETLIYRDKSANYTKFNKIFDNFFEGMFEKLKGGKNKINTADNMESSITFREKSENDTKFGKKFEDFFEDLFEKLKGTKSSKSNSKMSATNKISTFHEKFENITKLDQNFDVFLKDIYEKLKDEKLRESHYNATDKIVSSTIPEKSINYTKFDKKFNNFFENYFQNLNDWQETRKFQNKTSAIKPSNFPEISENYTKFDEKFDDFFGGLFQKLRDDKLRKSYNKINETDKTSIVAEKIEIPTNFDKKHNAGVFENIFTEPEDNDSCEASDETDETETSSFEEKSENYTKFNRKFDNFFEDLFERLKGGESRKSHNKNNASNKIEKSANRAKYNQKFDEFFEDLFEKLKNGKLLKLRNTTETSEKPANYTKFDNFLNILKKEKSRKLYNKMKATNNNENSTFFNNVAIQKNYQEKIDDFFEILFEKLRAGETPKSYNEIENSTFPKNAANYSKFDEKFDDFIEELFEKFNNRESRKFRKKLNTKNKNESSTLQNDDLKESNDNEHLLSKLVEMIDCVELSKNQTKTGDDQRKNSSNKQHFGNNSNREIDDKKLLSNIRESLKNKYGFDEENLGGELAMNFKRPNPKLFHPRANILVDELCRNCAAFVLGPSILCMVMSIKFFLIWLLNISLAVLTLYYDSLIEIRRKSFGFN